MSDAIKNDQPADPDKKRVLNLYAAFGVSLLLTLVPSLLISFVALVFVVGVLIGAYMMRRASEVESLAENHCTYVIRTLWISALISLITLFAGSAFMLGGIDYAPFEPCANAMAQKGAEFAQNASYEEVYALAEPCMNAFIDFNMSLLMTTALITAGPVLIYLGYRYGKGLLRALKGYRMANPKAWF